MVSVCPTYGHQLQSGSLRLGVVLLAEDGEVPAGKLPLHRLLAQLPLSDAHLPQERLLVLLPELHLHPAELGPRLLETPGQAGHQGLPDPGILMG